MADVVMPRLSDSMEEGTILKWLKSVGDEVAVGDELVEIETDKANMAYESDLEGTLSEIVVEEGATVPIGEVIARVGDSDGGEQDDSGTSREAAGPVAAEEASGLTRPDTSSSTPPTGEASPETAKGQVSYEELGKTQQLIARRMAESKATAPHFYLRAVVDMSLAVDGRRKLKEGAVEGSVVPSFNDMVVKACALALREHPRANGAYRDGRFELYSRVNVGVAVAAEDVLVVPTVFDADRKGLRQIAQDSRELAGKVREGTITPPELSGATFTVSNLGMYGIESFSAVINPPQAAILAVGAIEERPVVRDGEIATAQLMGVDLACDHRILYGAPAAEFLARIKSLLEEPFSLAL